MEEEVTFKKIANKWLEDTSKNLTKTSYYVYRSEMNKYLVSKLEPLSINELQKYDYKKFVDKISKEVNKKTARDITSKLKSILYYAEDNYDLNLKKEK